MGKKKWIKIIIIAEVFIIAAVAVVIGIGIYKGSGNGSDKAQKNSREAAKEDGEDKKSSRKPKKSDSAETAQNEDEAENADDAQTDENAAPKKKTAKLSKKEAAEEDARLLQLIEDEDSNLRNLLDVFVYEECDSSFLQIGAPLNCTEGFGLYLRYVRENEPANADELRQRLGQTFCEWILTEEQIEYVSSSICGRKVDADLSNYAQIDSYFAYGGGIGDRVEYNSLERFSVERVDADTWKVRAADIYNKYYGISYVKSNVCFTVVRNPDSCFDGYSLTYFEENLLDKSWAKLYYDYLTNDSEGIEIMESHGGQVWGNDSYAWNLIYVDDDTIPELYMTGEYTAVGDVLLYISKGRVMCEYFTIYGGVYIPYSGWLQNYGGRQGYEWGSISKLENGILQEKGNWEFGDEYPDDDIVEQPLTHYLGGKQVSEAKYEDFVSKSTDGAEWDSCIGTDYIYESCLDFLNGVIR